VYVCENERERDRERTKCTFYIHRSKRQVNRARHKQLGHLVVGARLANVGQLQLLLLGAAAEVTENGANIVFSHFSQLLSVRNWKH